MIWSHQRGQKRGEHKFQSFSIFFFFFFLRFLLPIQELNYKTKSDDHLSGNSIQQRSLTQPKVVFFFCSSEVSQPTMFGLKKEQNKKRDFFVALCGLVSIKKSRDFASLSVPPRKAFSQVLQNFSVCNCMGVRNAELSGEPFEQNTCKKTFDLCVFYLRHLSQFSFSPQRFLPKAFEGKCVWFSDPS